MMFQKKTKKTLIYWNCFQKFPRGDFNIFGDQISLLTLSEFK